MKIDKKLFKKGKIEKDIDKISKIMKDIDNTNKTIDYINESIILSNGEIVDKKNFSIMSLPSTKEVLKDI